MVKLTVNQYILEIINFANFYFDLFFARVMSTGTFIDIMFGNIQNVRTNFE